MEPRRVHFVGIGGYGMSAISRVLLEKGWTVTGSDLEHSALVQTLEQRGVEVRLGHAATHVAGAEIVVYSSSIPADNVELQTARARGIQVLHRSQMLAFLLNEQWGIAIAGTHGKTTTSSMIAETMIAGGLDPTYIIGAEVTGLQTNAHAGVGPHVVAEADESDGTFLSYYPRIAVVTNLEAEHLENYGGDFARMRAAYQQFVQQIHPDGVAVLCWDDEEVRLLARKLRSRVITYAQHTMADYRVDQVTAQQGGTRFTIYRGTEELGMFTLRRPGSFNASNALAAFIVCREVGMTVPAVARALAHFAGNKRRFQIIGEAQGVWVIDDYAHHPTEVKVTLQAARAWQKECCPPHSRLVLLFQPQRYSRTAYFMDSFATSFAGADVLFIEPIYAPVGEIPQPGVTAARLAAGVAEAGHPDVRLALNHADAVQQLRTLVRPGDLVLTMGAGDVWRAAQQLFINLQGGD